MMIFVVSDHPDDKFINKYNNLFFVLYFCRGRQDRWWNRSSAKYPKPQVSVWNKGRRSTTAARGPVNKKQVAILSHRLWLVYIAGDGLGYGLGFGFQTWWLHCTMQNLFTLHRLGLGSLLFCIGQESEWESVTELLQGCHFSKGTGNFDGHFPNGKNTRLIIFHTANLPPT